jgi:cytochrome c553
MERLNRCVEGGGQQPSTSSDVRADRHLSDEEGEIAEIAAFYAAQKQAFASLKARTQARLSRKL